MKNLRKQTLVACALVFLFCTAHMALGVTVTPVTVRPPNNDCDSAQSVVGDVKDLAFNTSRATFDGPGRCMTSPNIWYKYRATGSGPVTVSLVGSSFDTKLAVYNRVNCYPAISAMIECNDDFGNSLSSQITFRATAGSEYLIEVGGYDSDEVGPGVLNIVSAPTVPPTPKDDCANAIPVGDVTSLAFDTTGARFDGPGLCMNSPNIWYCYTASCTGDVTVSLAGSSYDTMLAVYNGCECYPVSGDLIECNDDANMGYQSEITFAAVAGNQYLIEIGGYGSETGQGVLNISCEGAPPPPSSKDDCINARGVGDVTNLPFDTTDATFDGPGLCMTSPNIWFRYTASCTGEASVSLMGSSFDTKLAAYNGIHCYPTHSDLLACNDDYNFTYQSQVFFMVTAGNQYLIEVGGYASETGQGLLTISCEGTTSADKPDLGDAPDSTNNSGKIISAYSFPHSVPGRFPTVFNDGSGLGPYGPVHLNDQAVAFLGKAITAETEADTGPDEDGVNNLRSAVSSANHDGGDDAVEMPLSLPNCGWSTIDYEVTVVEPGTELWVNVWLDFNRDGDWDDAIDCAAGQAREWAVQNQFLFDLPQGLNHLTSPGFLSSHRTFAPERIWMRITLSEQPWTGGSNPGAPGNAGSGPREKYLIGETEDYYFIPQISDPGECELCQDVNGDGIINMQDLAAHVNLWLANCP
ncbi:MAG: hypothetical protein AMJ65_14340 [Phycisphaerae bacterium SG8_4]|nr:MAG: hypothetical protein AMJ65_14340 [Phycisphaerae bacterium SG8_4]